MRRPKKDPQQFIVYRWEMDLFDWAGSKATAREIRKVIERCCKMYRVPVPAIAVVTKNRRDGKKLDSYYVHEDHAITLRPRHRCINDAVHEAAHAICDYLVSPEPPYHSETWFSIYLNLLRKLRIMPIWVLTFWAQRRGIKWDPIWNTRPENIRRYYQRKAK